VEDLGVDGKVILESTLKAYDVMKWIEFVCNSSSTQVRKGR
jgi:hypothetical protein